jgi:L-glutamine-phosphate cytidylyltransferase
MRAAVLAAGRGVRMGGTTPKTLARVSDGEPLLHYILVGLRACGLDDLTVVTGFGKDEVQRYVMQMWGEPEPTFAFNARYASWGNFHSVRIALDTSPGTDLLIVNSDLVVHPDVFRRVLDAPGDLVLAVERRQTLDEEDMRVELDGDVVRAIGKSLPPKRSHGEFCGVSAIRRPAARRYADAATAAEWRAATDVYYEDVYAAILDGLDARAAAVEHGEYAEVDEPADLRGAATVVEHHKHAWDERSAPPGGPR